MAEQWEEHQEAWKKVWEHRYKVRAVHWVKAPLGGEETVARTHAKRHPPPWQTLVTMRFGAGGIDVLALPPRSVQACGSRTRGRQIGHIQNARSNISNDKHALKHREGTGACVT